MADEAVRQLEEYGVKAPSHVFVKAGVGAMAGGVTGFLMNYYKENRPVVAVVEPEGMACICESAKRGDGKPHEVVGDCNTIMAGLNCGEPCAITWPILRDFASFYIAELDVLSERGMRVLAHPMGKDEAVVSGESGAATMGALLELSLIHISRVVVLKGPAALRLPRMPGWSLSVFSLSNCCKGRCERGVHYTLEDYTLPATSSLGVSNEIVEDEAEISLQSGCLSIILAKDGNPF